jgi:diaminopimelate decarboxylase
MSMTVSGLSLSSSGLVCDGVSLSALADAEGTPLYVYSAATVRARYRALDDGFCGYPHRLHYALKANSTFSLLKLLRQLGSAVDANSIWEIEVARRAGFDSGDIVFTGVGKSSHELERAVELGVHAINVESAGELERVEAIAIRLGTVARVAIRMNPDIDAGSHPHITTGLKANKFGVPVDVAEALIATMAMRPHLQLVALHVHVGSQMTQLAPIREAARLLAAYAADPRLRENGLEYLDLGGGLGISYDGEDTISPQDYVRALVDEVRPTGLPIVIEPGRAVVGPAGALLARVIDLKPRGSGSEFAVLDAGMTELMRPALYDAFHRIEAVQPRAGELRHYEIVGPVCESTDVVGRDRLLPPLHVGDVVAIRDVGAYGAAMASNYNRRPLPAEVMIDEGGWQVIRRRQTVDDLLTLEQ